MVAKTRRWADVQETFSEGLAEASMSAAAYNPLIFLLNTFLSNSVPSILSKLTSSLFFPISINDLIPFISEESPWKYQERSSQLFVLTFGETAASVTVCSSLRVLLPGESPA